MRRIVLFGGSFNPIHNGHLALARAVLRQHLADEVWMLVSPHNPLKAAEHLLDEQLRFTLVQRAVADDPHISASDFEFYLPRPSYTWITLRALRMAYPDSVFSLIIGADNWATFDRWSHPEEILEHHRIWVYPREGFSIDSTKLPEGVQLLDAPLFPVSSTGVRQAIAHGDSVADWLPPSILADCLQFYHPTAEMMATSKVGSSVYPMLHVVCGVIEFEGRILCVRRGMAGHPYTAGHWEFPGGKVEPGEALSDALVRELEEELDLRVLVGDELLTFTHTYPSVGEARGFSLTMTAFRCCPLSQNWTLREHTAQALLFSYELPTLCWAPADRPIVAWLMQGG